MSDTELFEKFEDDFQKKFEEIKIPDFEPRTVVNVHVISYKRFSYFREFFSLPCYIHVVVSCPKIVDQSLREFKTRKAAQGAIAQGLSKLLTSKCIINEEFQFIVPKCIKPGEKFPIIFEIIDTWSATRYVIGKREIDASSISDDGVPVFKTLNFKFDKLELDLAISKKVRRKPEFRHSFALCDDERKFRKKRIPITCEAMKKVLGEEKGPRSSIETPVVSLVGSGGGYRALVGMCGAVEALTDAGLMDTITYNCGLSGSAWYLTSAYTLKGVKAEEQKKFSEDLKERLDFNAVKDIFVPLSQGRKEYEKYLNKSNKKLGQPHTFANFFPGFLLGKQILGDGIFKTLDCMVPYVEDAQVPYPILVALEVRNKVKSSTYHAYMERTPYEISYPEYGINTKITEESSLWSCGFRSRKFTTFPLHFTIAMTGCAFSILLEHYFTSGGEFDSCFLKYVEDRRVSAKQSKSQTIPSFLSIDVDSEDDLLDNTTEKTNQPKKENRFCNRKPGGDTKLPSPNFSLRNTTNPTNKQRLLESYLLNNHIVAKAGQAFFSRNAILGRTVRVNNVALGLKSVKHCSLNPFATSSVATENFRRKFTEEQSSYSLSTTSRTLVIADAGVMNNVATDVVLRPQRTTDVMIVMDFSYYESEDKYDYQPLLSAASQAWLNGLEFPNIDFKEIAQLPPKELLIFPSSGPNCPIVLWFTLCNKNFKKLENYVPKSTETPPTDEECRKFNDFLLFGDHSNFDTLNFTYKKYHFDQLKELMYFIVTNNIEKIKYALEEAVVAKRKRINEILSQKKLVEAEK